MKTRRFRLTKTAKILSFILILVVVIGGVFAGLKTGVVKTSGNKIGKAFSKKTEAPVTDSDGNVINTTKDNKDTIK